MMFSLTSRLKVGSITLLTATLLAGCATPQPSRVDSDEGVMRSFSELATASLSDAVDQVVGRRGFMSHEIKPLFRTKLCGRAITVLAKPSTESQPPSMALELIDTSEPGKVLVIVMDGPDRADVAAFGGIMGTGSKARGLAGAVLDGGCRDAVELEAMNFPVFAPGIVPSSSLGRYVNVSKNEPVVCGGVTVRPGDIIVGDPDGIVVIPQDRADEVLQRAQELEAKEAATMNEVIRLKSIREATQKLNRI